MSWEHINTIFPEGLVRINDQTISTEEIKKQNLPYITMNQDAKLRSIKTKEYTYVWGKDGEYAEIVNYDVYKVLPHPDPDHLPLNEFGQLMVNNYFYLNDVVIPEEECQCDGECNCGDNCKCNN